MNKQLFFLKRDGWFEAELTENMLHATLEDLINWAYTVMERNHYRNYRIKEEPLPCFPAGKSYALSKPEREKDKRA
jgi:hypothetical protein